MGPEQDHRLFLLNLLGVAEVAEGHQTALQRAARPRRVHHT